MRSMARAALSLAVLAGLALYPELVLSADSETAGDRSCSALLLSADRANGPGISKETVFRATRILDVRVRAVIPANVELDSDDIVVFRFRTPNGSLYQAIEVPVSSSTKGAEKERSRPGYPFPLEVQQPKDLTLNGQPRKSVETRLPVGGTAIMESGLYGVWRVEAVVGDGRPCSGTFELQP